MGDEIIKTPRTIIRRMPKRGVSEREAIYRILDEAFVCHVGFTVDEQPFVIPTAYARVGDRLFIHGSASSRMLRALAWEVEACVTVTLVDGLVLARSAFNHSLNYRSVVIFGTATVVRDEGEKLKALEAFTEHIMPNRWRDVRPPTGSELKATMVLSLPLEEASAKVRAGPPLDDEADHATGVWAGVLPLHLSAGAPSGDPRLPAGVNVAAYVANYRRTKNFLRSQETRESRSRPNGNGTSLSSNCTDSAPWSCLTA